MLAGGGAAVLVVGAVAFCGWLAVSAGVLNPLIAPRPSMGAVLAAGALAGALPGLFGPRVRGPVGGALLGAVTVIAANCVFRFLDPAARLELASGSAGAFAGLLLPGVIGLIAPVLWAPIRAAAARRIWQAVPQISGRVAALALGVLWALMAAPVVLFAGLSLVGGLRSLRTDAIAIGLGLTIAALALVGVSCLCLWLAGVPRRSGALPGFDSRTPRIPA